MRNLLLGVLFGLLISVGLDWRSQQASAAGICGMPRIDCDTGHVEPANKIVIPESQLTITDITTNNVGTSAHGFCPKAPNDSTKYLNGTGAWSVPPGGSVTYPSGTGWWHITAGVGDAAATTPTAADVGADAYGAADAVQTSLTSHTSATGTAVHGLGTASTHPSTDFDASGAASTVQTNLNTHTGLTTTAHGGIVADTDSRLTDARTPTTHASTHGAGQSDAVTVKESQLSTSDVTTANADATKHGLLAKLSGFATDYVGGDNATHALPSPGTQWENVLDLYFPDQASQTLNSDTTYTIAAKTWTKVNSANDNVAMAITNGTGLVIQPKQTPNYDSSTRTAPMITIPMSSLSANIHYFSSVRVWLYVSADNCSGNYDHAFVAIDGGSMGWSWAAERGYNAGGRVYVAHTINGTTYAGIKTGLTLGASNRVMAMHIDKLGGSIAHMLYGAYGSGVWPALKDLSPAGTIQDSITGARTDTYVPSAVSSMVLALGAVRAGSATALSVTIARVKVDVALNNP